MNQLAVGITDYLLHTPWWAAALIAAVGVALFFSANRRQDTTLQRVGIAIFAVGVVLGVLAQLFPTEQAKLERRTRELVSAADHKDFKRLASLLDADTALSAIVDVDRATQVSGAPLNIAAGRGAIVAAVQQAMQRFSVTSVSVTGIDSQQTDTLITVYVQVISRQDVTEDRPVPSTWQLDFQQEGDDWDLERITLTRVGMHDSGMNPFSH